MKLRLDRANPGIPLPLSRTCKGIVQACVDSASRISTILSELREHRLLGKCDHNRLLGILIWIDTFLPFDLECGFSAGLVLAMTNGIHPKLLPRHQWLDEIMLVFDYMLEKGNVMAGLRKAEIQELSQIKWTGRPRQYASSAVHLQPELPHISPSSVQPPSLGDPFFDEWGTHDGLTGAQLVSLANALDFTTDWNLLSLSS